MRKITRKFSFLGIAFIVLLNLIAPLYPTQKSSSTASAAPAVGTEGGIWINKYEIVLYNNVFRAKKETVDIGGKQYEVYGGGEVFRNVDYKTGDAKSDFILDKEERLDIGSSTYKLVDDDNSARDGCAVITFSGGPRTGSLRSTCTGQSMTTSVTMERTESADVDAYINGDEIYMPLYVSKVTGIPNNPEEGSDVNGTLSSKGKFVKEDGKDPGNTGYAKREYVNCSDGKCYTGTGKAGEPGSSWARITGQPSGTDGKYREIIQARRDSPSGCQGDCSATIVIKARAISGRDYKRDLSSQQKKAEEFQLSNAKRIAFRDFFSIASNKKVAEEICAKTLTRGFNVEYTIDTLVNPIPGPYYDCLLTGFNGNASFNAINEMAGVPVGAPADLTNTSSSQSCGGSIPIISDLVCSVTEWLFNLIFEMFTGIIEWMARPPDMFAEQNSTLEESMKNLRNVANILFVFAFLMVVFQYLTNVNVVDAYFIKKFIPRLLIAVILVQASFWITAELNYFFYDLGRSIQSIIFAGQQPGSLQLGDGAATLLTFVGPNIVGILLILGLIMALVLLVTLIILAIRYVLLIVLAIFAPIAFACLAIPQLEGITKKWLKMYVQLLMMYPIMMLFIAASSIVGDVFAGGGTILQIMGLVVQILPFIILPFTFKFAGGIMAGVSAKVLSAPKKGYGAYKKGEGLYESKTDAGRARADRKKIMEQNKADRARRTGTADATRRMREAASGGGYLARRRAFGESATNEDMDRLTSLREEGLRSQDLQDAKHRLDNSQHDVARSVITDRNNRPLVNAAGQAYGAAGEDKDTDDLYRRIASGEQVSIETTDAAGNRTVRRLGGNEADAEMAMGQLASFGRDGVVRQLQADPSVDQAALQRAINTNSGALAGKAPDIVKGATAAFEGGMSAPALAGFSSGTVDSLFREASTNPTAQSALESSLQALVHGPDSKPLSDMSRGTAEALHRNLTAPGAAPVDPAIIAALAAKL
ncbi:hypothetical protein KBD20_00880 [Candidatus Saccharibacteria bacterium]|nr:hypothetical protein [Candidatus Saccharibacteria bacterium]